MVQCAVYVIGGSLTPFMTKFPILPEVGHHVRFDASGEQYEVRRVVIDAEGIPQLETQPPIELWVKKAQPPA